MFDLHTPHVIEEHNKPAKNISPYLLDCIAGNWWGSSYCGPTSTTENNVTCQKWSSQAPNTHKQWTQDNRGVGDHNHCRNPDGDARPWCYTVDPEEQWGYCDLQHCKIF